MRIDLDDLKRPFCVCGANRLKPTPAQYPAGELDDRFLVIDDQDARCKQSPLHPKLFNG
jgi:hypothetical protein